MEEQNINEQQVIAQNMEAAAQSSAYNQETDALLKKYLKMQIGMFYWRMASTILMALFFVGSIIFSAVTITPFLKGQMEMLTGLQSTMSGTGSTTLDINDIIEQINTGK